jgi:cytochrome c oxidase subunit 4
MSNETTAAHAAHDDHDDHGLGHIVSYGTLFGIGFALLLMTIITVAVRYVDAGELNMPIALGIAGVKATLVALYFMHLRWDRPFNALVLVSSIAFVVLLMIFVLMDTAQNAPQIFKGNAPKVQEVLTVEAPGAPIAEQSQLP